MDIIDKFSAVIIQPIVTFIVALGAVVFLYGVAEYVLNSDNADRRKQGATHMAYGIIGLAIMLGVWGILAVIRNTIGA